MKSEYINPFIEASQSVIGEMTGLCPKIGKVYVKKEPNGDGKIIILIGLTGAIQGNVIMSLENALACKITSIMMGGMPVSEMDDIAKSAIAELGNMILGNAASIFSKNSLIIDITPPIILSGEKIQMSSVNASIISVPLELEGGDYIEIDITYNEA